MTTVTFPAPLGGDGSTVSDDNDPVTGLGNGGHRTRFVPSLKNIVAIAQMVVNTTTNLASKASQVDLNATNSELDALTAQVESTTSSINTSLALKAPIASPAFTGIPTAPTPSTNDNTTKVATTAFVMANAARNQDATASQKGVVQHATASEAKSLSGTKVITGDTLAEVFSFEWSDVTSSRAVNTVYTNSGKSCRYISAIMVKPAGVAGRVSINGLDVFRSGIDSSASSSANVFLIVPPNGTYQTSGFTSITQWNEGDIA